MSCGRDCVMYYIIPQKSLYQLYTLVYVELLVSEKRMINLDN